MKREFGIDRWRKEESFRSLILQYHMGTERQISARNMLIGGSGSLRYMGRNIRVARSDDVPVCVMLIIA